MKKILYSRTNWTILVMFLIGGITAISESIPVQALPALQGLLGILAIYFKVNPSQTY